jgi:hypothetical protein
MAPGAGPSRKVDAGAAPSAADLRAHYRAARVRLMRPAKAGQPSAPAPAAAPPPNPRPHASCGPACWLPELIELNEDLRRLFLPPTTRAEREPGERIRDVVAAHYGITVAEMVGRHNLRRIAWPRQVAMYICARHAGLSPPLIVRLFGDRDRTTVLCAVRAVTARTRVNGALAAELSALIAKCGVGGTA